MFIRQRNGLSQEFDVKGENSPFIPTNILNPDGSRACVFWGRENYSIDGSNRIVTWFGKNGTPNASGPATNTQKPTHLPNAYSVFPAMRFAGGATLQHLTLDSIASLFNGDDTPVTVVRVFDLRAATANTFLHCIESTTAANPRHLSFLGGAGVLQVQRRDNAGAVVTTSTGITPTLARHITVDIFDRIPAGTGVRTLRLDGVATAINNTATNVGTITFNAITISAIRNGTVVPVAPAQQDIFEEAIFNKALLPDEVLEYEAYAKERYAIP